MSCLLFIPTYWSTEELQSWKTFDHPFPITEDGTLCRTLANLRDIGYADPILLLPVPSHPKIVDKVLGLSNGYDLDLTVFTSDDLDSLRLSFDKAGAKEDGALLLDSTTYGGVRNIGLAYAGMHGFDQIIMIDDDECIAPDYQQKALRYLGEEKDGQQVLGKTGCVVDGQGRKIYDGQAADWLAQWPKDALFNKEVGSFLDAPESLSLCTLGFGGNMVIDRRLFTKVPFDPLGTRGEDDDYLLNCRYCGHDFFFDKDLLLTHLPPARSGNYWSRQRQDIIRFLYTREKLRAFGTSREVIGEFQRYFTDDDLERKAVCSSIDAATHFLEVSREETLGFLENAKTAVSYDRKKLAQNAGRYKRMIGCWQKAMDMIARY
ncbi:MAG: glycosyltransferase family 2 protein [Spirochaetia bacterium]|jgi:hypothetical protein|nr:glycosyltransferase family 2 protein [Spirochaetia bacterium]